MAAAISVTDSEEVILRVNPAFERITGYGFDEAKRYLERTEPFWAEVRAAWADTGRSPFAMKAQPDQASLFLPFFEYADELAEGKAFDANAARRFVRRTLADTYLAPR